MRKRLIRKAINEETLNNTLKQLSENGRKILKEVEDYKFKLDQTCRIIKEYPELERKFTNKKKQLDIVSGQIYSIVYDCDNIDITKVFEQEQINTQISPPKTDKSKTPPPPPSHSTNNENDDSSSNINNSNTDIDNTDTETLINNLLPDNLKDNKE